MTEILILAHRGIGKGRGENSINAFRKGMSEKADGIELDIRITKDRKPVCVHDESLERVFGKKDFINHLTLSDLKALNLYDHDNICLLEDVFKKIGNQIFYDIEIKDPDVLPEFRQLIQRYKPKQLMVSSFKHACLKLVKEQLQDACIAPIIDFKGVTDYHSYILDIILGFSPYSLNLDVRFFQESVNEKLNWFSEMKVKHNVKLAFWTVNTSEELERISTLCDFLITDKPKIMKKQLE